MRARLCLKKNFTIESRISGLRDHLDLSLEGLLGAHLDLSLEGLLRAHLDLSLAGLLGAHLDLVRLCSPACSHLEY